MSLKETYVLGLKTYSLYLTLPEKITNVRKLPWVITIKSKGVLYRQKRRREPLAHEKSRLTTLHVSSEAENGEPQLQNKRGRLTTLHDSSEAENGEPQLQNKRGKIF